MPRPPRVSASSGWLSARFGGGPRRRRERQDDRRPWWLVEVEVVHEVAELGNGLAHSRTWIGTSVGVRVQACAAEEVVLDELQVGVVAERLMVDEPFLRVRRNHEARHA